jgi:hypothetical protein
MKLCLVRAVDSGEPPLYSEAEVSVRVRDDNDNTPAFIHPPDVISLRSEGYQYEIFLHLIHNHKCQFNVV